MIDKKWIGYELDEAVLQIERSRLKFFAKAIGENSPVYLDEMAARDAGYPDLPAPPTFLFAGEMDAGSIDNLLVLLEVPIGKILHGEQSFIYHKPVYAGDTITFKSRIGDIFEKKNGALEFIVKIAEAYSQENKLVAELRSVIVVRN
jgi:acyl dehydratase